jgi:hypothetical protein
MNKTKLAVFCLILAIIMWQMCIDAAPGQDNTSFRVVNTTQRSAFQRTQAASRGRGSGAMAQQGQQQGRTFREDRSHRGNKRNEGGARRCRGDKCPIASTAGKASAPSNVSAYELED